MDNCPFCHETRRDASGKARRFFSYIPLVPRFRAFFQDPRIIELLSYRAKYVSDAEVIRDIFDGSHYKSLLGRIVEVDGKKQSHRFFSDHRDIAFGFANDAFLLFNQRRGGPSATTLLVKVFNFHPSIRTHIDQLLCVGEFPGPKQPKDLSSFLAPFDDECAEMAQGVPVLDTSTQELFDFHGYQLTEEGDIISIEKWLGLKGHSSSCPCRSCLIRGCRKSGKTRNGMYQ